MFIAILMEFHSERDLKNKIHFLLEATGCELHGKAQPLAWLWSK